MVASGWYPRHLEPIALHVVARSHPRQTLAVRRRPTHATLSQPSRPHCSRQANCRSTSRRSSPTGQHAWNYDEDGGTGSGDSVETAGDSDSHSHSVFCGGRSCVTHYITK